MKNNLSAMVRAGFDFEDAKALRRISMTLWRWHEMECGTGDSNRTVSVFRDDNDKPFLRISYADKNGWHEYVTPTPDREKGAHRRLAKIMKKYPSFISYIQGDPRGCALYVIPKDVVPEGGELMIYYERGIALF